MDDAVACGDVGLHDIRATGLNLTGVDLDGELFAIYGFGITRHNVLGHDFAWNNVVGQHGDQLLLVFWLEQVLDRAVRELGKGFVGGRKNGEGPFVPFKVSASPAAFTAATRVLNCSAPAATLTIVFSSAADRLCGITCKSAAKAAAMCAIFLISLIRFVVLMRRVMLPPHETERRWLATGCRL